LDTKNTRAASVPLRSAATDARPVQQRDSTRRQFLAPAQFSERESEGDSRRRWVNGVLITIFPRSIYVFRREKYIFSSKKYVFRSVIYVFLLGKYVFPLVIYVSEPLILPISLKMNSEEARRDMACHVRLDEQTWKALGARGGHGKPCPYEENVRLNEEARKRVQALCLLNHNAVNFLAVLVDLAHR